MGFFGINPEAPIIVNVIGSATPEPDDKAAFREIVNDRYLLRQSDWVMQRHLCDSETNLDVFRRHRERRREVDRIHIGAIAVEMMLGKPQRFHAELVAEPGFCQGLVDDLAVFFGNLRLRKKKVTELHVASP